jgi:hypothetical protein
MNQSSLLLPPEIWAIVFRFATETAGEFDTSELPPLEDGPRSWDDRPSSIPQKTTKLSLSLVSKLWNRLSMSLLYEHVRVSTSRGFLSVLRTLEGKKQDPDNLGSGSEPFEFNAGWHTKCFDITFRKQIDLALVSSAITARRLVSISSVCPNLRMFEVYTTTEFDSLLALITDGETRLNQSIRHLRVGHNSNGDSLCAWVSSFPMLEVLIMEVSVYDGTDISMFPPVSLPYLHTLRISDFEDSDLINWIASWDLPSFRRLVLNDTFEIGGPPIALIDKFGAQLAVLDLTHDSDRNVLPYTLSKCTNLVELAIFATFLRQGLVPHPNLERIVLEMDINSAEAFEMFMETPLAQCGPRLKVVRVRSWNRMCTWSDVVMEGWKEMWGETDVRFEYNEVKFYGGPRM